MSNYSDDPTMVRVDFFRPSGKWYTTEAVKWVGGWSKNVCIWGAYKKALIAHFKDIPRLDDMVAVCLEPYHEYGFPLMMKVSEIYKI